MSVERLERPHMHYAHAHPPHPHYSLSSHNGGGGGESVLGLLGTLAAAHPVGLAIGAVALLGIGAYCLLAED